MSKLEQLIKEKCPNGVEFVKVKDVVKLNAYKQLGADELEQLKVDNGNVRLLPSSNNNDWFTTQEIAGKYLCYGEVFTMGRARHANTKYVNGYFVSANNVIIESNDTSKVLTRFLFHFITNHEKDIYIETSTYPKFDKHNFESISIPVPPLEVQREIVGILDNFTLLSAELSAELSARYEQYNFYKNSILPFNLNKDSWMKLGKVAKIVRGGSPRPINNYLTSDKDGINWIKIGDVEIGAKYITSTKEKITVEGSTHSRFVKKGDFILSNSMSFGRPYILQIDGCIHDGWLSISDFESKATSDYLYYILTSDYIQNVMKKKASFGGAVQNLNKEIVENIEIPVPELSEQKRIVDILDRFDTLCNDVSSGLPAEIEARQKQYEYYRDKLLTFKRLEA